MNFSQKLATSAAVAAIATALAGGVLAAPASAAPGVSNISVGSGNTHGVWCVQLAVNNWAERTGQGRPLVQDGKFGTNTKTWVVKFQKASGLGADGIVGPSTGNSILDNDGGYRAYCYDYVPSTRH
ncbi:peptidoglycan-binding domain-containing protein [Streptomyces sp. NPDC006326]|uniref:peptidoglycan-binding domain-containing protein n=1 Tax=Streptomyces sp. NPDC006326 TaxID=3156752 RepID=UPI0033ADF170